MPAGQGETLLTTIYADVHYKFKIAAPSQPQLHRFSQGSYVYLYYSAIDRRAKLEIANHAGTADQDAFHGYLDAVQCIKYTSKQPTMCSIVLDQAQIRTQSEWHLPTWDDRNEKRWAHKLHTVDLYFWKERDALQFMNSIQTIMPAEKLDVSGLSTAEHRDSMSPVVQQLEKTAIGAQFPPRAGSTTSAQSLPGPPTPASTVSQAAPMAYNPAAPAAPEPISHREKTPPPPDGETGTGLTNATRYDSAQPGYPQYSGYSQSSSTTQYAQYQQQNTSSLQNTPQSSYFPGPPQATAPSQPQRQASYGTQSSQPSTQYAAYQNTGFAPSVTSPGFGPGVTSHSIYSQQSPTPSAPPAYASLPGGIPPPPPPPAQSPASSQHSGQQAQVAGFSPYTYSSAPQAAPTPGQYSQAGAYTGNTHAQVYRPTEEEAAHSHHKPKPQTSQQPSMDDKYRISERVSKMEKGLGGFLKKLDQKF